MADDFVRLDIEAPVGVLTLCRPDKLNAWSWESARQLADRAEELRFDDSVRAVVIKAEGRAFCAGADLGAPEDRITGRTAAEKVRNYYERFRWIHERFQVVANLPQPIIVAINGYCLGAGLEVAMMGDIRVAADDAVFALPEVGVGVSIDAGADMRMVAELGAGWTKLLALTGRRFDAAQAESLNLVQQVVPADELESTAMDLAREIAGNAPLAVQAVKRTINAFAQAGLAEAMRFEAMSASVNFVSDDMIEGFRAKAEKRPVEFEGK